MHLVSVVAFDGISPFHLSVPSLVLGHRVLRDHGGDYRVEVCSVDDGPVSTSAGYALHVEHGLGSLEHADTVVLPSWDVARPVPESLRTAVVAAHHRGARIVGLCLGTFAVAECGLVDGREVTTHWWRADELRSRRPAVDVRADLLWSDLGDVVTSAGVAAALDCCVHLVRSDLGTSAAAAVARHVVMAPHRVGSQAQYMESPVLAQDSADPIDAALAWARGRLADPVELDAWSGAVHLSRRTFSRRFRQRTGTSPAQWLIAQRLEAARDLLETTDEPIESVARRCGFGTGLSMRQHFRAAYDVSPSDHRRAFRTPVA